MASAEGLTTEQADRLLAEHGLNALPEPRSTPLWKRFARQFLSPLIYVLLFAVAFDVAMWVFQRGEGLPIEGIAIAAILLLNAMLGTFQEYRSEKALARLKALTASEVWVLRDGKLARIPSEKLVPGDVVRVDAGERIPADGLLLEVSGLMADEAVLTGESLPVDKSIEDELQSGTLAVRGHGTFLVSRTGPNSAMGKIAGLLSAITVEPTPLERRLAALGNQITRWIVALIVVMVAAGLLTQGVGRFEAVVMFAVALAVAAIPEGMPAVVALTLALGVQRMASRRALVRKLSAVESLGSVTVVATDKTGTLTENQMSVRELETEDEREALLTMVLANEAAVDTDTGNPLDLGLLAFARSRGVDVEAERGRRKRIDVRPFDSQRKFMGVTIDDGSGPRSYVKGAPEEVIGRTSLTPEQRAWWLERAERSAGQGYRVLAMAGGEGTSDQGLSFFGLAELWDPPRPEVPEAIAVAQRAGVRVMMITGDHPGTARAVAEAVGIPFSAIVTGAELDALSVDQLREVLRSSSVFARVSPAHKLKLVEALKADGHIVAMTGDGVNDAPALKRADVGIAMGKRGSDVAREVADLVLLDDNFATIVGAIEEGRGIYENIQAFIRFTFSTNVALMLVVVVGAIHAQILGQQDAAGMLLVPLTALQLLWINFLGDGPPALALGLDKTPGQMSQPPRPPESGLLDGFSGRFILATGAFKGAVGIALLLLSPRAGYSLLAAQTMLFLYESVGKLVSAYPSRRVVFGRPSNPALHVSIAAGIVLQMLTLLVPGLRRFLGLAWLDTKALIVLTIAVVGTWAAASAISRRLDPGTRPTWRGAPPSKHPLSDPEPHAPAA